MIEVISILMLLGWAILIIGMYKKDYAISLIGSMFILVMGVYIVTYGITDYKNWFTEAFGIIHIGVGAYILIKGSMEGYKDLF